MDIDLEYFLFITLPMLQATLPTFLYPLHADSFSKLGG